MINDCFKSCFRMIFAVSFCFFYRMEQSLCVETLINQNILIEEGHQRSEIPYGHLEVRQSFIYLQSLSHHSLCSSPKSFFVLSHTNLLTVRRILENKDVCNPGRRHETQTRRSSHQPQGQGHVNSLCAKI